MKKKRLKRRLKAQSTLLMETTQLAVALKGRISVLEKKVESLSLYYSDLDERALDSLYRTGIFTRVSNSEAKGEDNT